MPFSCLVPDFLTLYETYFPFSCSRREHFSTVQLFFQSAINSGFPVFTCCILHAMNYLAQLRNFNGVKQTCYKIKHIAAFPLKKFANPSQKTQIRKFLHTLAIIEREHNSFASEQKLAFHSKFRRVIFEDKTFV